jgi:hypothetical protein
MASRTFLGTLRLALLIAVLVCVALGAWLDRRHTRSWEQTLRVTVYPLAAGDDPALRAYASALNATDFSDVEAFFADEAQRHSIALRPPLRMRVSHAASTLPPALPARPGPFTVALWSLRLRWYAARVAWSDPLPTPDVQVFATFAPITANGAALPDSIGLSKGLVAIAHLYGDRQAAGSNQVVVAHELLHTLGATDKYDPASGQPLDPDGLGEPERSPRYPQPVGEIMAGRIATSPHDAVMATSLRSMRVGTGTAREIGWAAQ